MKYIHDFNSFFYDGGWKTPFSIFGYMVLFGWCFHSEIHQLITNILTSNTLAQHACDGIATLFGFLMIIYKDKFTKK